MFTGLKFLWLYRFLQVRVDINVETGLDFSLHETFGFKLIQIAAVEKSGVLSAGLIRGILQAECGDSRVPQLLRAHHLIVPFVYLAAPLLFLCR